MVGERVLDHNKAVVSVGVGEENDNVQTDQSGLHEKEQEDCGEDEDSEDCGDGAASQSILTKGIKFASTSEFLSFVNEDLTAVEDMEENMNSVFETSAEMDKEVVDDDMASGDEAGQMEVDDMEKDFAKLALKASLSPVVRLKRLSRKTLQSLRSQNIGKGTRKICGKELIVKARDFVRESSTKKQAGSLDDGDVVATHASLNEDKKYHCKLCVYASTLKGNMRSHLEGTHSLGAGWDCEDCGKHYKLKKSLFRHRRSST